MPTIKRDGRIILPEFEEGRIIICERKVGIDNLGFADFGIMKRPQDEEAENHEIFWEGFTDALKYNPAIFGNLDLHNFGAFPNQARFIIDIKQDEQGKGYGTVLMNAGAQYCRSIGLEAMWGIFDLKGNTEARERFYERLDMPIFGYDTPKILSTLDNPLLRRIPFTFDPKATKILNTIPQLMRP